MTTTDTIKTKTTKNSKNLFSGNLIQLVEAKFVKKPLISGNEGTLEIGDIIRIGYLIPEGTKDRTQYYEGLIIAKQNRGLGQSFTLRRSVQGVGVEQIFLVNSPKIVSITRKQSSKVRRAKLYYLRALSGKATRLKAKL
jgi:large subunit ribosomal protein L19